MLFRFRNLSDTIIWISQRKWYYCKLLCSGVLTLSTSNPNASRSFLSTSILFSNFVSSAIFSRGAVPIGSFKWLSPTVYDLSSPSTRLSSIFNPDLKCRAGAPKKGQIILQAGLEGVGQYCYACFLILVKLLCYQRMWCTEVFFLQFQSYCRHSMTHFDKFVNRSS